MYRKLVLTLVLVLGLMTFVSAQAPVGGSRPQIPTTTNPSLRTASGADMDNEAGGRYATFPAHVADSGQQALVKQFAKAKGEEREKIKAKLSDALEKAFDLRQKRHQEEIAALEAQVSKLKELVQKRQANRGEIVTKRFEQLVREAEGLGW
jgi:hypothetical protein